MTLEIISRNCKKVLKKNNAEYVLEFINIHSTVIVDTSQEIVRAIVEEDAEAQRLLLKREE